MTSPVVVTVLDTDGTAKAGVQVMSVNAANSVGGYVNTNSSGQATLNVVDGSYRFYVQLTGTKFYSGAANHCVVPGCTAASITVTKPVLVTVTDASGAAQSGLSVAAVDTNNSYATYVTTNASGQASIYVPQQSWRFGVTVDSTNFWSGDVGSCTVPGCTSASIVVLPPVAVSVVDTDGTPQVGSQVTATTQAGSNVKWVNTNASGVASIRLAAGAYSFSVQPQNFAFKSGTPGHCALAGCTSATITVSKPVQVTVRDGDGALVASKSVLATSTDGFTSVSQNTNAQGVASFVLPQGHWRFQAACSPNTYYSGTAGSCLLPGCQTALITLTTCGQCAGHANGSSCNDANSCTTSDHCQDSVCVGTAVTCTAQDQCHTAGTCNPGTGTCSNPAKADGTSCSDGNACTQTDTCQTGTCTGANPVTCTASDQCHTAGTCNTGTGTCSNPAKADGTSCSDGNACTQTDTCQSGACTGASPVTCTASDQCHTAGTCDPANGTCSNPAKANGTSCSDGNACTQTDTCQSGTCAGANPVTCTASNQCHTAGSCDSGTGTCSNPAKADGTACDDGNASTSADHCTAGTCAGSAASCPSPATCRLPGVLNAATGVCSYGFKPDGSACDDGNASTHSDRCQSGACLGVPAQNCSDYEGCDDGNPCTQNDSCYNGVCHGEQTTCGATSGGCASYCDPTTGACTTSPTPDGTACDDGSSCTSGDVCSAGTCAGSGTCTGVVSLATPDGVGVQPVPSLPLVLSADRSAVHPNDVVQLTAQLTYDGVAFNTSGYLDVVNNSPSEYLLPGYSIAIEYQSAVSHEWIALAQLTYDAAGQLQPSSAPYALTFKPEPVPRSPTVTYPASGLAGTRIGSGGTARFYFDGHVVLPPVALAIIADPAQSLGLRQAIRVDASIGLPTGGEIDTPIDVPTGTNFSLSNVGIQSTFASQYGVLSPSVLPSLQLGAAATFTGSANIVAYFPPPTDPYYMLGLTAFAQKKFAANSYVYGNAASFGGDVFFSYSNSLNIPTLIPVIKPTIVGPGTTPAGYPLTFDVALPNVGTEAAANVSVQYSESIYPADFDVRPATITAPTTIAAGETKPATMVRESPVAEENNVDSIGVVSWTDAVGNVYGPVRTPQWGTHLSPPLPLGTVTLSGQPGQPVPVGDVQTLSASALDPHGSPAVGVTVQVAITGANAQTLSAVTNNAGVATFSYEGRLSGGDTAVASATITTAPAQSGSVYVFWSAPYGAPCVATDAPLDVMLIIDSSASMESEGKLEGAKAASLAFLNTLDLSRDQLGVGYFNAFGHLSAQLTSTFSQAKAGIDNVATGDVFFSPTNIGAGLTVALDELESSRARSTATPVIIFLTDGGNSFGDPEPAMARLETSGIRTIAFGLGSDADALMLNRIATSRNDYYYAPTASELTWLYGNLGQNICRNQKPLVNAGGDHGAYGVRLPHVLTLQGEVHDDGSQSRLTSEWTVVSGPGVVTFTDASTPVTTALFTEPGTYVLRLTANDGTSDASDEATITVDPEPSLMGATLVTSLGMPGPLTVGSIGTLVATLKDSGGHPISNFPVQITVAGPNAATGNLLSNASGVATFAYTGTKVGTDVLTASALALSPLTATPVSLAWTGAQSPSVATQGWIGSPAHQSTISGQASITVGAGVTLTNGTVTYWPMSAPDQVRTLATGVSGGSGATIATLDTTLLANGPWVVKLDATDDQGHSQVSLSSVTVGGDYKPGRVVVEVTDLTIPAMGLPVSVGRRYDSLEKDNVGDFGNGWSLMLGHPRLEVDQAHNVTLTMPDNRRVTFYFAPSYPVVGPVGLGFLLLPAYQAEPGVYGSLTADGCPVLAFDPFAPVPSPTCFGALSPEDLPYAPTTYTYTDPYGRVFVMGAGGELKSITDRQHNSLTFTPSGILSSSGVSITFERDAEGRITKVTSPPLDAGNGTIVYTYDYNTDGNLSKVHLPGTSATMDYTYTADHYLLKSKDANGNFARTLTYDAAGRLETDKDALGNVTSYAYALSARKTTITNPDEGTVEQTFDDRGLLLKEVDPLGRTTEHTYDTNRNELTRKNAAGEVTTYKYDPRGNQTSIKNARGETTTTYDEFSLPVSNTDPVGRTTTIAYADLGIPTKFSDQIGTLATFTSSEHGVPLTVTDAAGNTAYLTYDSAGNLTSKADRLGRVTRYGYDGVGRRTSTTDPRGGVTRTYYLLRGPRSRMEDASGIFAQNAYGYEYDGNLNLTRESSDLGRFTNYTYDALNHLTLVQHADGTTTRYTRDFRGNPLTETDESSRTTTFEYDKAGQLKKTTFPDGTFTTKTYDDLGRTLTSTDERGNTTSYEYEAGCGCADRMTKVTDPLGRATTTTYDAAGRRSSVTDAAGHTTTYSYDVRGHLTTTTYADATTEVDAYDTLGRRTSHTDQMGSVTQYGYDAEGQLTSVTDALTHVTHYAYDGNGNLTGVTDANSHTTSYDYDRLNRKTKRTLPLGMYETFAYNMYGDNTTHVDFRGKTTTMTYDPRARLLTKVPDPTLGEPTVSFTYNPTGTRASMADASGSTTYTYDSRDRLLRKATPAGTLTYTHDPAGNVATIRSSNTNGTSVDYGWDAANQLISVTDNRAGGVTTSAYTATGRPSTLTQPSGVGATYSYDTRDRVTSVAWALGTNPAFGNWAYDFNGRGQRTSVTDEVGRHVSYGYDAVAQLVSETIANDPRAGGNGELSYSLDPRGNRLSRTSTLAALSAQTFTYDANDQLSTDGYDANGSTTASDGHAYGYDFENRLVSKDAGMVTIVYDGDGNRVAKTVVGVTTKYLIDDLNPTGYLQVLEEVSGGAVQRAFTYGNAIVSQRMVSDDGRMSYYGFDGSGNIAFLTDADGVVTDTYDYDAWGNLLRHGGDTFNARLFRGEEYDLDLGLLHLRAREYRASTGRFLTIDPLDTLGSGAFARGQVSGGTNGSYVDAAISLLYVDGVQRLLKEPRYLYGNGDPVMNSDPTGLSAVAEEASFTSGVSQHLILTTQVIGFVGSAAIAATGITALANAITEAERCAEVSLACNEECNDLMGENGGTNFQAKFYICFKKCRNEQGCP